MDIGWSSTAEESGICYSPPVRFVTPKDGTHDKKGYLSCIALRGYFSHTFVISAPYSLHLRFEVSSGAPLIRPVYPFTTLSEQKVQELISVEPISSWRNSKIATIQIPSPYVFFSDEPVILRQEPCLLTTPNSFCWRQIPGKFNIFDWQRPLNWACEWFLTEGDLIIKAGEPLYFVSFESVGDAPLDKVKLVEVPLTEQLKGRMKLSNNVVSMRRGLGSLMKDAGKLRENQKFIGD
jgi:hypothetical protein